MTDFEQRIAEAIVAALDTYAPIVTLTGRASGNVVPWEDQAPASAPCAAYELEATTKLGGVQDTRRCTVRLRAVAATRSGCNMLLGALDEALTSTRLASLSDPVDAYREYAEETRSPIGFYEDSELYARDIVLQLVATLDLIPPAPPVPPSSGSGGGNYFGSQYFG